MKRILLLGLSVAMALIVALAMAPPLAAQYPYPQRPYPGPARTRQAGPPSHWIVEIYGGVHWPMGETKDHLNFGGHLGIGGGYRFSPQLLGLVRFTYYGFGLNSAVLQRYNEPAGDAHMWALSPELEWRFSPGPDSAYAIGGVGYYDRVVEFTRPTVASTFIFDPWFGYFGPALVPANVVIGSFSSHAFGADAGLGYEWELRGHRYEPPSHVFVEARFHYANTRGRATLMLPITVGIRF